MKKEYVAVFLNKNIRWTKKRDLADVTEVLNKYAEEGWTLMQVVPCAGSITSAMVGIFYREKSEQD